MELKENSRNIRSLKKILIKAINRQTTTKSVVMIIKIPDMKKYRNFIKKTPQDWGNQLTALIKKILRVGI